MMAAMSHPTVGQRIPPFGCRQPKIWMGTSAEKGLCDKWAHKRAKTVGEVQSLRK